MANNIVKLNVGGVFYTTTRTTLCSCPDSMLGTMFNGTMESTKDENGCYFIDRDGELFKYILNFLRSSELAVLKDITAMKQLRLEAIFYQIMPLVKTIDELLVPKQLEYIVIEHMCSDYISSVYHQITIRGTADLITKYFENETRLDQVKASVTDNTYATLNFSVSEPYDLMSHGKVLCRDGWKLACTTSAAMASDGKSGHYKIIINKDTWSLEK